MMTTGLRAIFLGFSSAALIAGGFVGSAWAINDSIPFVNGDVSRSLLGDGTGVVFGVVDSGVDDLHPALAGNDSQGNPRMVAEANFVTTEPSNTGDDGFGHGTWVSSVLMSKDATYTGMAPDARYVNARVLNSSASFQTGSWVQNGIGFAVEQGVDILNLSLNYSAALSNGDNIVDLMLDWAAYDEGIHVAVSAGNISATGGSEERVRAPGSHFNGFSVGRTTPNFELVHSDSSIAPTFDGRMKPDLVAPGSSLVLANDDWEGGASDWDSNLHGTSFSAPHVSGLMAQALEYGNANGLSTNPLVVKSTIAASTLPVLNKNGDPWAPASGTTGGGVFEVDQPLDLHGGAGQIDGARLATQYMAGEQSPGIVDPVGWDLGTVAGTSSTIYVIDDPLKAGTDLTVALTWFRHVARVDNGDEVIGAGDLFFVNEALDNLDLEILHDGSPIATSISTVDNLEFLRITVPETGSYQIRVNRLAVDNSGSDELYGLAWYGIPVITTGDFDGDGDVDGDDFIAWQSGFGITIGAELSDGDGDGDGDVDGDDFLIWQNNFGTAGGDAALRGLAIPEPSGLAILLIVIVAGGVRVRKL